MRALICGIAIALGLLATTLSATEQTGSFEYLGLKPGMTIDQVKQIIADDKLGKANVLRAPSFEQKVAASKGKQAPAGAYAGVQLISVENISHKAEVIFAELPEGPKVTKVLINLFSGTEKDLRDSLSAKYGAPRRETDLAWLWGDDASLDVIRKSPYLEVLRRPISLGAKKPVASVIIADPAIEKSANDAYRQASQP